MADSTPTLAAERREAILAALAAEGRVLATELAERLDVSLDTVRRDLQELAAGGALRRVRGGALPAPTVPPRFDDRRQRRTAVKQAIGEAAAKLIGPCDLVAVSGGTTVLAFAQRLSADLCATVVTDSPDVALAVAGRERLEVVLAGGRVHPETRTVVGSEAVAALRDVRPDVCVLGVCSLHPVAGLTLLHREEAQVVAAMIDGATRTIALADAEKLGTAGPFRVAPLDAIDVLVSDAPNEDLDLYRDLGVEVIRA